MRVSMLTATFHRPGTLEVRGVLDRTARMPLTRPIDDHIALAQEGAGPRAALVYLELAYLTDASMPDDWREFSADVMAASVTPSIKKNVEFGSALLAAAALGADERSLYVNPTFAGPLAAVRFIGRGTVEIPHTRALAAWALLTMLENGTPFSVRPCELCGVPFLSSARGSRYCRRAAPTGDTDSLPTQTCLEVGKVRDYRVRKAALQKTLTEYRSTEGDQADG